MGCDIIVKTGDKKLNIGRKHYYFGDNGEDFPKCKKELELNLKEYLISILCKIFNNIYDSEEIYEFLEEFSKICIVHGKKELLLELKNNGLIEIEESF